MDTHDSAKVPLRGVKSFPIFSPPTPCLKVQVMPQFSVFFNPLEKVFLYRQTDINSQLTHHLVQQNCLKVSITIPYKVRNCLKSFGHAHSPSEGGYGPETLHIVAYSGEEVPFGGIKQFPIFLFPTPHLKSWKVPQFSILCCPTQMKVICSEYQSNG